MGPIRSMELHKDRFHVTSYQANFANPYTHDSLVGFLFFHSGIGKHKKVSQDFSYSSYHNTKLQLSDKYISTHTWVKFKILLWSESKIIACFVVFLHTALYKKETNEQGKIMHVYQRAGQNHARIPTSRAKSCTYTNEQGKIMHVYQRAGQHHARISANPLLTPNQDALWDLCKRSIKVVLSPPLLRR